MTALLRSLARIAAGVAVGAAILYAVAFVLVRQPVIGSTPYEARVRNSPAALRHVDFLTTEARPRDAAHVEKLDEAARYIARELAAAGARVSEQPFVVGGTTYRNVIAAFGPDDDTRPLLVVGAHYDVCSPARGMPGADDNASGTAGLLELARLLGTAPPRSPVMLVAYANEEPPFFGTSRMGSAVHAQALGGRPVAGMICLEMIGYFGAPQRYDSWVIDSVYPRRGDFIAVGGGWSDRVLARAVKKAIRGAGGDGHRHRLSAQSELPRRDRSRRDARLRADGACRRRRLQRSGPPCPMTITCWLQISMQKRARSRLVNSFQPRQVSANFVCTSHDVRAPSKARRATCHWSARCSSSARLAVSSVRKP